MNCRAVYFDCDSTLSAIEGVDELGRFADEATAARLRALTADAMDGRRPLDEVYPERLRLLAPTAAQLGEIGELYVEHVVPGAVEVVAELHRRGVRTGIVSGGLLPAVRVLAHHLGIATVHAVDVTFDDAGNYLDFDRASPLWRNRGKLEILARVPDRPLWFVGDGVTDLETQSVVDRFVGFGGVVEREPVRRAARHYIHDLRRLTYGTRHE